MLFPDYDETHLLYHIASISDLKTIFKYGLRFNRRLSYKGKYHDFHRFMDKNRTMNVPGWVMREKAVFASLNFKDCQVWHSHSAILSVRINEDYCWVANENTANYLYEPFILNHIPGFASLSDFLYNKGKEIAKEYWENSMSFKEYLLKKSCLGSDYDAEVLMMNDIKPNDIKLLAIITDHRIVTIDELNQTY
ncbi:hypothetical protein [Calorimonas adulescens]|uniref:DUF4433 domain-containing protein n=1 Tax=Calorimonas adulescens TaxID=2606906 RepID=A0A5D8QEN5_9THEO|nr:hypothetical protein [Calorimonas adulescens]TZE81708.1 hypothetical protein FWJ32_08155 [Calorimonas adulescens]